MSMARFGRKKTFRKIVTKDLKPRGYQSTKNQLDEHTFDEEKRRRKKIQKGSANSNATDSCVRRR